MAAEKAGAAPAILNAANEVAVEAFLQEQIAFTQIPEVIEFALENHVSGTVDSLEDVLNIDNEVRRQCAEKLDSLAV